MCVLILRVAANAWVAANRDEAYARPFSAPRRWVAPVPFWAPRDEEEGGTWIGVNARGLVAAITNRSTLPERTGLASRGHLVAGLLGHADATGARAWLEGELARAPRNPCQLCVVQGTRAWFCRVGPDGVTWHDLAPGIHVLSNLHEPDEIDFGLPADAVADLALPILRDPSPRLPRGFAVCKRAGWRGTVASALIEPGSRFLFAGGPPDEAAYDPVGDYPSGAPAGPGSAGSSGSSGSPGSP